MTRLFKLLGVLAAFFACSAHACDLPAAPAAHITQAEIETYLRGADSYLVCERKLADEGKPLQRKEAYEAYLDTFTLMQKAADRYNAALKNTSPAS